MPQPALDRRLLLDGLAYADRWLAYRVALRDLPGLVVAVRHGDDLVFARAYGYANLAAREPMTTRHVFRVASHSKTFTATAVMQLVERGRLRLDDRLDAHVPWLRESGGLGAATLRQVLNHAAGIVRDGPEATFWQVETPFPDADGLRRLAGADAAVLDPNRAFKYSNVGFSLLGLVVEAASGQPYNAYVREHVVERLGLADTGPDLDRRPRGPLATGYVGGRCGLPRAAVPEIVTHALSPATGFYSTAEDLCAYAAAHLPGDERLLSDASKREMQQPYWAVEQADESYGLGLAVQTIGQRRLFGHGGGFPGQSTRTLFDPRDRLVVVVLSNWVSPDGMAAPLATSLVRIVDFAQERGRAAASHAAPASQDAPDGEAGVPDSRERFTGRFENLWGAIDVAAFGDALVALNPAEDDPGRRATDLRVLDADSLRIEATSGYGSPGERVRYERDADGRPTRVLFGGGVFRSPEALRRRLEALAAGSATAPPAGR